MALVAAWATFTAMGAAIAGLAITLAISVKVINDTPDTRTISGYFWAICAGLSVLTTLTVTPIAIISVVLGSFNAYMDFKKRAELLNKASK